MNFTVAPRIALLHHGAPPGAEAGMACVAKQQIMINIRKIVILMLLCLVSAGWWQDINQPLAEPAWEGRLGGLAYAPMRPGHQPAGNRYPTAAEIDADLALLAQFTDSIRTYSVDGTLGEIPRLAGEHGLAVSVGAWIDDDLSANRSQLSRLRRLAMREPAVERALIGNETLLTERVSLATLIGYLDEMRAALEVPVSTAEPWHIWLDNPQLADHVDFLTVHLLPYWEGVPVSAGAALVERRLTELKEAFPGKQIVIGEVGWPSNGRTFGAAAASRRDAETFLRQFLTAMDGSAQDYFLMEAFDQPWKRADEGEAGAYWGIFDAARQPKYRLAAPLVVIPNWPVLALLASLLASAGFLLLTLDSRRMRLPGHLLIAATCCLASNTLVWALQEYLDQYWTAGSLLAAVVLLLGLAGIVLMACIEIHDWAESAFKHHNRVLGNAAAGTLTPAPKVSIHVPAYDEPPAMLEATLEALAALEYPNFEVLVIDNNTPDEATWRPVEAHCARLGERFRFFHVSPLAGFKAGALNYALERTAADAEIIAVIDSDYCVQPDWLRQLVPVFADPQTALVQAPQDYRDHRARWFKRCCEAEYRGFFANGMITRNERNAIIQHGTMTMIRAAALRAVGGWSDWSITEDTELGLRLLQHGYTAHYTPQSHGRGLTPDKFSDYRTQRFRWALGAMQILRRHGRSLLGLERSELTRGQKFHFLTGWAPWLGDGLSLCFNFIAISWSLLMVLAPARFLPPVAVFSTFVLALFGFKLIKTAWLYIIRMGASPITACGAIIAGLSLVYISGHAVLAGLAGRNAGFVRTPKLAQRARLGAALQTVLPEAMLALALLGSAVAVTWRVPMPSVDLSLWRFLLIVFAVPHCAALSMSLLGSLRAPERRPTLAAKPAPDSARG